MSQSLHPMLNIAIKAARAAGAIINRGSLDLDALKVTSKGPNDFVSEIDHLAEAAIIDTLLAAYPGHAILAEESGRAHGAKNSEFCWIIDPLDGTTNFLHGLPVYAVSIALSFRGVVQQAVVYDPTRNDLFYASRGRGAFLNDKRLRVSKRTRLADSLIGTGFPFRKGDSFQRYLKMFETVMQACAGLRRPGAAALDLCYVAAGWYDGFFETGLNPWDVAAGSLIITEAGGLVGNFTGESDFLYQREIVAGTPKVYGQLVALLAPFSKAISDDDTADAQSLAGVVARLSTGSVASDTLAAAMAAGIGAEPVAKAPAQAAKPRIKAVAAVGVAAGDGLVTSAPVAATSAPGANPAGGDTAAPAERERKPVRIRKIDLPADAASGPGGHNERRPARGGQWPEERSGARGNDRGPQGGGGDRRGPSAGGRPAGGGAAAGAPFKPRRKPGDTSF